MAGGGVVSAPGHGTQPSAPCPNCGRSLVWYAPICKHCGYDAWTGKAVS